MGSSLPPKDGVFVRVKWVTIFVGGAFEGGTAPNADKASGKSGMKADRGGSGGFEVKATLGCRPETEREKIHTEEEAEKIFGNKQRK